LSVKTKTFCGIISQNTENTVDYIIVNCGIVNSWRFTVCLNSNCTVFYLSRDSISHFDAIFKKAVWWKLAQDCYSFDQLLTQCNSRLFSQSIHVDHCLHFVLP